MRLPPRLRPLLPWAGLAAMAALPFLLPLVAPQDATSWVVVIQETMLFAVLALGLNITVGLAGLLVLGHAAFWALGAYTYAILTAVHGLSFWLAFPLGAGVAALAGVVLGVPSIRLRGDYLAIVTLGFGEVIRYILKNFQGLTGGDQGIPGIGFKDANLQRATGWLTEPAALTLRRQISTLDQSGDMLISPAEAAGAGLRPGVLDGLFARLDQSGDGLLSAKELLAEKWGFQGLCPGCTFSVKHLDLPH